MIIYLLTTILFRTKDSRNLNTCCNKTHIHIKIH